MSVYELIDRISKIQSEGKPLIRLDIGQPDLPVPPAVKQATQRAIDENKTGYTHSKGIPPLRERVAEEYGVPEDHVIITAGGKFPIFAAFEQMEGNATLVRPCWGAYTLMLKKLGKLYATIDTTYESGFRPDFSEIPRETTLAVINYPNNPTGMGLPHEQYKELSDRAVDDDFTVLSDEVYTHMSFTKASSITEFDCDYICIGSFSKTFSMTGYRLGYAIARPELIKKIQEFQQLTTTSPSEFAQYAALTAMNIIEETSDYISDFYRKRRDEAVSLLRDAGFEVLASDGTFYLFPRFNGNADEFAMAVLDEGVSVLPGSPFGPYENHFRISLVTDKMAEAVEKMGKVKDRME
jgi:aspartate aminotransferase